MAIRKTAKNIVINITQEHRLVAGTLEETAQKIFVYATEDNLTLNSNKKIITNGNK